MKYLNSAPFSSGANSKSYSDNWEKIFGKKEEEEVKKEERNPQQLEEVSDQKPL
jgi:hypothetical protein